MLIISPTHHRHDVFQALDIGEGPGSVFYCDFSRLAVIALATKRRVRPSDLNNRSTWALGQVSE